MSDTSPNNQGEPSISVVIPTLGGETLSATIEQLNLGTLIPTEILVCIPGKEAFRAKSLSDDNVTVVETSCYGQVEQRALGFQKATGEFVLQLDDDMLLEKHCLEHLFSALKEGDKKSVVAPSMLCDSTGESPYQEPSNKWMLNLYYWLLNGKVGYRPGTITQAGTNIGVDLMTSEKKIIEADWVAGGCLMHRKENLILDNFYPFRGKSYSEDLYHSYYLKQKGVKLLLCASAQCFLDCTHIVSGMSIPEFLKYLRMDIKARARLVKLLGKSIPRMYIYYFIHLLRYMVSRPRLILKQCLS